ncbi:MAG TPA: AAA family ATPase [Tepidisphaeraceae bacterium]|jgi:SpoVK/Ycf46/Vps4 family AAA+-type ATPase
MTDEERFQGLLQARYPAISVITPEEEDALDVVLRAAIELQLDALLWSNSGGVRDGLLEGGPGVPDTEHPAAALYHLSTLPAKRRVIVTLDLAPHLSKDERTLRQWRDLVRSCLRNGSTVVMIDYSAERPDVVSAWSTEFELSLPDEAELEQLLRSTLRRRNEEKPVQVQLSRRDLDTILRNLKGLSRRQARQIILETISEDNRLDLGDVNHILATKRKMLQASGLLEYVESPVDLSEIGGLAHLKAWLAQRQCGFSKEAAEFGLSAPKGVLMLGVQGAGKSLSAKAVATAWQMPLMRMDVGALYDKYIGESERRLRDTLRQAEAMAPIVLWIDEIEKAFASAASRSTDGGLSQRMFGTLLTWMQERRGQVFTIATANDIEALPAELLRKGRFDEIFFVDLPNADARIQILSIHLKKRGRDPAKFDLPALAQASDGFSGAEIEQAILAGLHAAFTSKSELKTEHVLAALAASPPIAVTMAERITALRGWARGRCVPAD